MWHTTHLFSAHGAIHLTSACRLLHPQARHTLLTKLASPAAVQTLLLAAATLMFVLACLGLIVVGAVYAH